MRNNLGGFTQIFPVDPSVADHKELMKKYEKLIGL